MKLEPGTPLDNEQIEKIIAAEMVAGLEYVYGTDNIAADRERNYEYYCGIMNDLPAPPGRSRVVEHTMANYIGLMKPSLLRIFTSGRNVAEYVAPKPDSQNVVKLVTRFINDVVFRKDNRGELILGDWAEDALIQKLGVCMYWWEERFESKDEIHEGIPDEAMVIVVPRIQAHGDEIIEHSEEDQIVDGPNGPVQTKVHSLKVRVRVNKSKCCIETIPPEEFVISRDARTMEDAVLKGHRCGVMVGDLVRAGYPLDEIENLPTYFEVYDARNRYLIQGGVGDPSRANSPDPMLRKVAIFRGILKCDRDGTGIKDWYVVSGGLANSPKLLEIDQYNDQIGFADFCPEPMPHVVYGRCPGDRLAGQQKIDTVLSRGMLDSLYLAITPQREVVMDWIVKPDQLSNMSPGASLMVKQPGAVREIAIPFVGREVLSVKEYFQGQAEITTGVGRNTAGLDPETLSNQSATANNNMMSAQQGRVEMIARIWAQGGMRKLFRGVFRCIKAYQDFARIEEIDGKPETIDPRTWEGLDDLQVNVNTGLGTGNRERDFAMLTGIAVEQKEVLAAYGPQNPIVDLKKMTRTLQLKCEAAGISYPENFFGDPVNPDGSPWKFEPPPPQPTPDTVVNAQALVQIEHVKAESAEKRDAAKLVLEREQTVAEIASKERIAYRQQDMDAALASGKLQIEQAHVVVAAAKVDAENIRTDMEAKKSAA